jgi:hypothetical protein
MSDIKNNGGTALSTFHGMTLRDYFAAKAMQAYMSDPNMTWSDSEIAREAYVMADAMLEARGE